MKTYHFLVDACDKDNKLLPTRKDWCIHKTEEQARRQLISHLQNLLNIRPRKITLVRSTAYRGEPFEFNS